MLLVRLVPLFASRLKLKYSWQPEEFTPSGQPKLDETILSKLPYKEAKLLSRYMMITKRVGQVAKGSQSWLKKEQNGRIHGSVMTLGAVTRRMTHSNPNIAQVPSNGADFGKECRALFTASKGYVLVGCDADALELRCLAGYMAKYDGGAYIDTILKGDKALGTDMHSVNARAVADNVKVPLNDNQFAALVSFTYNVGVSAFKRSTLLKKLNRQDYESVPVELMKWTRSGKHYPKGLKNRRVAEGGLWVKGGFVASRDVKPAPVDDGVLFKPETIAPVVGALSGMGGVFFRRQAKPKSEIINDRNGEIANLFRILQRHYQPLLLTCSNSKSRHGLNLTD